MYGSNSEEDNQAFGLSVFVVGEGVEVDGWVLGVIVTDLS